jgi:hypothetical protein
VSNNLALSQVAAAQNQKEVTINDQAGQLDAAISEVDAFLVGDGNVLTLTAEQFRRHVAFDLQPDSPGPDASVTLTVPAIKRGIFVVLNGTGFAVQVAIDSQPLTGPIVEDGSAAVLYCDGTNVQTVAAATGGVATLTYDFGFSFPGGPPSADEVLSKVVIPRDITIPADMAGASGHVDVNPDAQLDIDVTVDGATSIGTIAISTLGVFTFTTADNDPQPVAAGSVVRFVGPATPVGDALNIAVTLQATVD